jgi:hypothetical protein
MADETTYYKTLEDISIPKAVRRLDDDANGDARYQHQGHNYPAGSAVSEKDISPVVLDQIEAGAFEGRLEKVSGDELAELLAVDPEKSVFIPEHEQENVVLKEYGHETLGKDAALEAGSAGAEAAKEAIEAGREDGFDERPGLTLGKSTDLAEASREGADVVVEEDDDRPHTPKRSPRKKGAKNVDSPQTDHPSGAPKGKRKAEGEGQG